MKNKIYQKVLKRVVIFVAPLVFLLSVMSFTQAEEYTIDHEDYNLSIWDFSGPYTDSQDNMTLSYTLIQDAKGKLTGYGTFDDSSDENDISIPVEIKGKVKGKNSIVTLKYKVKGQDTDANKFQGDVSLELDERSGALVGTEKRKLCVKGEGCEKTETGVSLEVPDGMTGKAVLSIDAELDEKGKKLEGTGELTLSNGDMYNLYAKGKYNSKKEKTQFQIKGVDESIRGIKFKLKIDYGSDNATFIKGKAFGQQLDFIATEYSVVCDPDTSLCWQDPQREAYNYDDIGVRAFEADQYCEELILGGFDDWRVPTIMELRSITAGFPGTETDGACSVVDGNITYGYAQFQLSCFNMDVTTGNGPGDNGCYLKPGFTGTCDKPDPYSGGHPLEHVALETPSDTDDWRSVLMFENGSVLFNHACTGVDVRCVRNDDGPPIVKCVESEPCDSGTIKSCECSGFGDRPDGTQACNEADNCWGPCECTKSVIDTSVDTECYAGDDLYDQADILTVNINLPADDTIEYDPAVVMAFLYECPDDTTIMPIRPPDGGSWDNQVANPGKPPYSIPVHGVTYYRESLIEGRHCLLIQMGQQNRIPPIPESGDYLYWDPTQGVVFPLAGGAETVDVTLEKIE